MKYYRQHLLLVLMAIAITDGGAFFLLTVQSCPNEADFVRMLWMPNLWAISNGNFSPSAGDASGVRYFFGVGRIAFFDRNHDSSVLLCAFTGIVTSAVEQFNEASCSGTCNHSTRWNNNHLAHTPHSNLTQRDTTLPKTQQPALFNIRS